MVLKTTTEQHTLLHTRWPNDCCLCSAQEEITRLRSENAELLTIVKTEAWRSKHIGWILRLNKYQRDNLLWLLSLCRKIEPFTLVDNGDWLCEILYMLSSSGELEEGDNPNETVDELKEKLEGWKLGNG